MTEASNTTNSLAHTKWNCKYHIVFAPKYRRKVFFEQHRSEVREILRKLCEWQGVEIIEGKVCVGHVHILVSIPPKMSGDTSFRRGFDPWGSQVGRLHHLHP